MIIAAYAMGITGLQLHPRRDLFQVRERFEEALKRRRAGYLGDNILGSSHSFQLHALHGFGAYICGEEPRCSNRWKAKGPAALQAAVPGQLRPLRQADHHQQHRDLRRGAVDHPQRRRTRSAESASRTTAAPRSSRCRRRRAALQLRDPDGHAVREAARTGRRRARRRKLKAVIPGGSSSAGAAGRIMMDATMDLRLHRQGRLDAGFRGRHRDGRDPLRGQRAASCRTSTARVLRPVHALPRRHRAGCGARWSIASSTARAVPEDLDLLNSVAGEHHGAAPSARSAMPPRCRCGPSKHFRDEFAHHIEHKTWCLKWPQRLTAETGMLEIELDGRRSEVPGPKAAW